MHCCNKITYLFSSGKKLSHEARGSLVFTYFRFGHRILFLFSIKEKVLCNYQIIEIITNSFVHFHLFLLPLAWYTEKKNGSREKNNGGESKSLLWFSVVFLAHWSTIAWKSLIAVTFSTSIMLTRGHSCCAEEEKW